MYGINHDGLEKKQTYDELIDYIANRKARIKYPNRDAKLLRESPTLISLLDGDGQGIMELDKLNEKQMLAAEQASRIQELAAQGNMSPQEIRAGMAPRYV